MTNTDIFHIEAQRSQLGLNSKYVFEVVDGSGVLDIYNQDSALQSVLRLQNGTVQTDSLILSNLDSSSMLATTQFGKVVHTNTSKEDFDTFGDRILELENPKTLKSNIIYTSNIISTSGSPIQIEPAVSSNALITSNIQPPNKTLVIDGDIVCNNVFTNFNSAQQANLSQVQTLIESQQLLIYDLQRRISALEQWSAP